MSSNKANGVNPPNWVPIGSEPLYTRRKLRVVCAGSGFAGLTLAYKIKHELQLEDVIDLVIYEKNAGVGGTWFENRYPGVACDIPAHAYTFVFEPNPDWSAYYAPGHEIRAYIDRAVKKWGLDERVQFNSKIESAKWDEEQGKWHLTVNQNGTITQDTCDIFVNATGFLNKWKWPKVDGFESYKGKLIHTAHWEENYEWEGKRIAVLGNGSSGLQAVAAIAPKSSRLVNYVRNPTWISVNFIAQHAREGRNFSYTEVEKRKFREDPQAFLEYRKMIENGVNQFFFAMCNGHPAQEMLTAACKAIFDERLKDQPELADKMIPKFKPGCRRLSPGDGYLEAFSEKHVDMCWEPIASFTERGIRTTDGKEEEFDVIVCATGFDTSFVPSFAVAGRNGATLAERWADEPDAFFSVQVDGMPNYFMFMGPNAVVSHGSILTQISFTCDYILRWAKKIATEDIKALDVKPEATADFNTYTREFLKGTAWGDECKSWYKNGKEKGPVTGTYGGSFMHFITCLQNLGPEHFNLTYNSVNRFSFLGNGQAIGENHGLGDLAYYMDDMDKLRREAEKRLKITP